MNSNHAERPTVEAALRILLASCEKLQSAMGGTSLTNGCDGLLKDWDHRDPTIFYLERNMQIAREVLEQVESSDSVGV